MSAVVQSVTMAFWAATRVTFRAHTAVWSFRLHRVLAVVDPGTGRVAGVRRMWNCSGIREPGMGHSEGYGRLA